MSGISSQTDQLVQLLNLASIRQRVIAHNVANVNTPGYRHLELSFDEALQRALERGDAQAMAQAVPQVIEQGGGPARADGNNVDINQEMTALDQNTLLYRTFAQALTVRFNMLRSAITGR